MSSTNRGKARNASDYYVTPIEPIMLFLRAWAKDEPQLASVKTILDPCAGGRINHQDGKVIQPMSYVEALHGCADLLPDAWVTSMDIRPDSAAGLIEDYLQRTTFGNVPQLIMSNPPFSLAAQFIRKALADVAPGGFVVFLLRLNYFGGTTEKPKLWADVGLPERAYVHARRMSFTADGKQDSIEYMHAIWRKGHKATQTILKVI